MNKLVLFFVMLMVALTFMVYPQTADRSKTLTTPAQYGWTRLVGTDGAAKTITSRDTSVAVDIYRFSGANILWIDSDTTVAGQQPDSCMTVQIELFNPESNEWGKYYTAGGSKLDTIPRSLVNVGSAGLDLYMNLPSFDQYQWAQKVRFIFIIGTGDIMKLEAWIGGQ
jgi:hypothetical protein